HTMLQLIKEAGCYNGITPRDDLPVTEVLNQVCPSTCLKEDPATMSLLQRSLDPEKTLGLVDVLYTAVLDLNRWRAGRLVSPPLT
ncbi:hypothetical protein A6R68_16352, partial [Neotoma lepida]